MKKVGFLLGISLFWLVLSVLSDGINPLLLPERLMRLNGSQAQATQLGLFSFVGLLAVTRKYCVLLRIQLLSMTVLNN